MLWYKAWLETRWRFLIGLGLLICVAAATVFSYPRVVQALQQVPGVPDGDAGGELGRAVREGIALSRSFRGYVWSQLFRQNLVNMWTCFAVLLGTGGLLAQSSGGAALYSLSMPASRRQQLMTRAGVGFGELLVLAFTPALMMTLLAPAIGERYAVGDALLQALCLFVAGGVFFSLAFLLSTVFGDLWRPLLLAFGAAIVLGMLEQIPGLQPFGIFRAMSGEVYFRNGAVPWLALMATAVLSAGLISTALFNIARRDF